MAFENLRKKDNVQEEGDTIYSSVFETGVYPFTIDMALVDQSEGGAAFLSLSLIADDGRTLKQTVYFTSGDEKGNSITYPVKKNGKPTGEERYLPGYILASDLHEIVTEGVELAEMNTETKLVKAWDKESSSEKPMEKEVLVDLLGKKVKLAVQHQILFKTVNQDGKYVETDETVNRNEVVKVFHAETNQTISEAKAEEAATFMDKWIKSYAGVVFDKTKKKGADEGATKKTLPKKETGTAGKKKKLFS